MSIDKYPVQVEYLLPQGFTEADYDMDKARYRCPNCEEFAATKHSGKLIGDCNNCGQNLNFKTRKTTFVKEV